MFGGLTLEERVDLDFARARRRAFARRVMRWVRGDLGGGSLLDFDVARRSFGEYGVRRLGLREVEVAGISGSVGRWKEFDRDFMPVARWLAEKWMRVDRAFQRGRRSATGRFVQSWGRLLCAGRELSRPGGEIPRRRSHRRRGDRVPPVADAGLCRACLEGGASGCLIVRKRRGSRCYPSSSSTGSPSPTGW